MQLWRALVAHPADPTGVVAGWTAEWAALHAANEAAAAATRGSTTRATEGSGLGLGRVVRMDRAAIVQRRMDEYFQLARRWCAPPPPVPIPISELSMELRGATPRVS